MPDVFVPIVAMHIITFDIHTASGGRQKLTYIFEYNLGSAFDTVGFSLRINDELVAQAGLPVLNVPEDEQSPQTCPQGVAIEDLETRCGWGQLTMSLDPNTNDFVMT